jgi:UrcA family protein
MYTKTAVVKAWPVFGAAIVACTFFAGDVLAKDHEVAVAYRVNARELDLSKSSGARELYRRLEHAAWIVCTHGNRVDLAPAPDPDACYEKALGEAVRSAKVPLLTQAYLESHSTRVAAAYGIEMPVQVATK